MSTEVEKSEVKTNKNPVAVWCKDTWQFLREVWIEVRPNNGRVTWPTFENVKIATKVVIISSIALGLFIGLMDHILTGIVKAIMTGGTPGIG